MMFIYHIIKQESKNKSLFSLIIIIRKLMKLKKKKIISHYKKYINFDINFIRNKKI